MAYDTVLIVLWLFIGGTLDSFTVKVATKFALLCFNHLHTIGHASRPGGVVKTAQLTSSKARAIFLKKASIELHGLLDQWPVMRACQWYWIPGSEHSPCIATLRFLYSHEYHRSRIPAPRFGATLSSRYGLRPGFVSHSSLTQESSQGLNIR